MPRRLPLLASVLICSLACTDDGGATTSEETGPEIGDGDGDPGDGDGAPGDGDGAPGDGDGDGDLAPDLPPEPEGCVIRVKPDGNDALLGLTWLDAKASLTAALDAAEAAGEPCQIWVAAGTYRPSADDRTASFVLRPNVWVYGGFAGTELALAQRDWAANVTVLSGDIGVAGDTSDNSHHVVVAADNSRLDGFTITGANSQDAVNRNGAAILAENVGFVLAHAIVLDNLGGRGGDGEIGSIGGQGGSGVGLFQLGGSLQLLDVEFRNNVAGDGGNGLSIGGFGGEGAGAFVREVSSLEVRGSRFIDNRSGDGGQGGSLGGTGGPGAGLEIIALGAEVVIADCLFEGNVTGQGGPGSSFDAEDGPFAGLYYSETSEGAGSLLLANSEIVDNVGVYGAGLGLIVYNGTGHTATVVNTVIRGNVAAASAGGVLLNTDGASTITLANLTITGNSAQQVGGLHFNGGQVAEPVEAARLLNSVVWGNNAEFFPDLWTPGSNNQTFANIFIDHVDAVGGCPDTVPSTAVCGEVVDVDPLFEGLADVHLQPSSPLIDAGDAALLPPDGADLDDDGDLDEPTPVDLDGLARVAGGAVDLGAYELP